MLLGVKSKKQKKQKTRQIELILKSKTDKELEAFPANKWSKAIGS